MPIAQTTESPSSIIKQRQFTLSLVLCGVILPLVLWVLTHVWAAHNSSAWPSVEGTLTTFEVIRSGKSSRVTLRYHYHVRGKNFSNDRIDLVGSFRGLSPQELWDNFAPNASVRVFYDPRKPDSSALVTGVPTPVQFLLLPMLLSAACVVLFVWSSYVAVYGPTRSLLDPDLEDPRSLPQRVGIAILGLLIVCVFGGVAVQMVMLPTSVPHHARDPLIMGLAGFAGLAFATLSSGMTWLGVLIMRSALRRPETLNDLRKSPDAPNFSESSLIALFEILGTLRAIIVDHEQGKIHFRKFHVQRGKFIRWPQPWFSCSLREVIQAKRETYTVKGQLHDSLLIETTHGAATVGSKTSNYTELCRYFESR